MEYAFLQNGGSALTVALRQEISPAVHQQAAGLCAALQTHPVPGVTEVIPAYCAVTVCYDPARISGTRLKRRLRRLLSDDSAKGSVQRRVFEIPVCYQAPFAPDMDEVSAYTGLSPKEIAARHAGQTYLIYMLGFLPGFPYLGGLPQSLYTPRRKNPRTAIPAGSIGIGGEQTGVYPIASPGGWQLIGKTPVRLYDPSKADPIPYRAGDCIRFFPVSQASFAAIERDVANGVYPIPVTEEAVCI